MGASLRKPVAVNNWESLTSEANRLYASCADLVKKAQGGASIRSLYERIRVIKSQTLMIRVMLLHQARHDESRQAWIHTWWDSMDTLFTEFKEFRNHSLAPINELEERLLN